ncbi:mitochondrial import receptor subunit TOM9-2-like [Silene latifolia]|uniref:mitochondrial import receptor subunit TOM9-2-like n=1 Tax=Silene latifolia TaxID=37657 RepID=UPI003D77F591
MASTSERRSIKSSSSADNSSSIISRVTSTVSESSIVQKSKDKASDALFVGKKLSKSTGKAAWIAATTAIVLLLPLIIEFDRDSQLDQLELQASLLGSPAAKPY